MTTRPSSGVDKGFMAQAGDPTGTGRGGESVYGHPFNDEFHSRLKFNHRSGSSSLSLTCMHRRTNCRSS